MAWTGKDRFLVAAEYWAKDFAIIRTGSFEEATRDTVSQKTS
jgi:hypothetical protein